MKKIFFILAFLSLAKNSLAFTVNHEFDVFIGKFNASRTSFSYSVSDKDYTVSSDVKTYGLFDKLYPFQAVYSTEGKIGKDKEMKTVSYKYVAKSRFNRRTKELVYNDEGIPVYRISSKNEKEKKSNVNVDVDVESTTDLQTVMAELVMQYAEFRFCDARMEVFDGKKRFDVIFKDEGNQTIKANKYSAFEGSATKCSMYIDNLGSKGGDMLWEISSDQPVYFWIMEDENKIPFIARLEIKDTKYGRVQVYTKNVEVRK
ncbi:MAG: DUF3108 domain-containing protein [Lactobacillaceae bacterium]|jgi:hypothetical protein|nr:DUF3108 domain-containing protein [Lactobacillaceae bacterium]